MADEVNQEWWATAGTMRQEEIADAEAKRSFAENVVAGFQDTALSDIMTVVEQEGAAILEESGGSIYNPLDRIQMYGKLIRGQRAGEQEDYSAEYETLTTGVPSRFHDEILDEPNLAAAERARARVDAQLERGYVASRQHGLTPALGMIAGSLIDVDAPLMLVTGGGYKAAAVARNALKASQAAGLSAKAGLRVSSAAIGLNAGFQAGAIVGLAQATVRETADWTLVADSALQGMILGGAGNLLLKGDVGVSVRAAQEELYTRMARDDPSLNADWIKVDPNSAARLRAEDHRESVVQVAGEDLIDSTVGARMVRPVAGAPTTAITGVGDEIKDMSQMMDNWRHDSGWQDWKIAEQDEWWTKVALSGITNLTTRNVRDLYTSNSSGMNWLLGNVFESPNGLGRGRFTAAAGMGMYLRRITQEFVLDAPAAAKEYARRNPQVAGGPTPAAAFHREVMLEQNDRLHKRKTGGRDPAVIKAANAYDRAGARAAEIGKGEGDQLAVDGFEHIDAKSGYSPYVHNGAKLLKLEMDGVVSRADVIEAYASGYRAAGTQTKDAKAVATAVVERAVAKGEDVNTSLVALLQGDGRAWLNTALESSGMTAVEREGLMRRLTGIAEERGKEGFAKSRNDLDLSITVKTQDGSNLQLVDLLDNDLPTVWQRYSRRLAGAAALARVGITNKAKIEQIIQTIHAQQKSIGEPLVNGDLIRAMFSHFDGGPIKGYSTLGGMEDGVSPYVAVAKRMTNLALLGKVGLAQAAETGTAIATAGFANWLNRAKMEGVRGQLRSGNNDLLNEFAFITGRLGQDHHLFAPHLDLDDMNVTDHGWFMKNVQNLSQKGSYYQGMLSGFHAVHGWQQRVASAAMLDKIFRKIKDDVDAGSNVLTDERFRKRMRTDLGLFDEDFIALFELVENGTIEFATRGKHTYVDRSNAAKWPADVKLSFGASLMVNMNQVVQKSMAGEEDAWMHTTVGSTLVHLKTFPLAAVQKQAMRNIRHMDMQSLTTVMYGMATAGLAVMVKDAIDGKERSVSETAKSAFGYSNMTGWIPMYVDPALTMLGLEDMRFNQYGPHSEMTPPVVTWTNKAMRLPGAAYDTITGQADYYDKQSIKALPFANLVGLSRILD